MRIKRPERHARFPCRYVEGDAATCKHALQTDPLPQPSCHGLLELRHVTCLWAMLHTKISPDRGDEKGEEK